MSVNYVFGRLPKTKTKNKLIFLDILIEVRVKMIVYIKDFEPGLAGRGAAGGGGEVGHNKGWLRGVKGCAVGCLSCAFI